MNTSGVEDYRIERDKLEQLVLKRIHWAGWETNRGKGRKIPIDFDGLLNAVLSGAIPNISKRFEGTKSPEDCAKVVLDYLMKTKDISSSHFPTILQKSEAPNYHFSDYQMDTSENSKENILNWLLSFYYIDLIRFEGRRVKQRTIIGIRSENRNIKKLLESHTEKGGLYHFKLKVDEIIKQYTDKKIVYYLPRYPSSAYFTLLFLLSLIMEDLKLKHDAIQNLNFETLLLNNSGGNKWTSVYHPVVNLERMYNLFFNDEDLTDVLKYKFVVFLESLKPPRLQNQNVVESYYSLLSSLAFSILIEGCLNVQKLSQIISEKISLELRAKRERLDYNFSKIFYVDNVQSKFFGGEVMGDLENLRKQLKAIAYEIGKLANKGDTQKSLLKRIILDLKSEETPITFVEKLVSYLPRLERENIKVIIPQNIVTLPIRDFFIVKNEFIVILWNNYAGGERQ
ncbi:MAG: hypothetical protein DRH70_05310 [Candidatus Coatesbacteria bacterium]|nr:MAG: hypothetical protein DRH70_05310 [Candidatus Coatesbacteria bacterium]